MAPERRVVGILACTQIISWGSLYYAFGILGPDIQRETGWSTSLVYGAYSWSMLVAGVAAAPVGAFLDRYGGRLVMACGSAICGAGQLMLSASHTPGAYFLAWTVLGLTPELAGRAAQRPRRGRRHPCKSRYNNFMKAILLLILTICLCVSAVAAQRTAHGCCPDQQCSLQCVDMGCAPGVLAAAPPPTPLTWAVDATTVEPFVDRRLVLPSPCRTIWVPPD